MSNSSAILWSDSQRSASVKAPCVCLYCGWLERYWPGTWQVGGTMADTSATTTTVLIGAPRFTPCQQCDSSDLMMLKAADVAAFLMGGLDALFVSINRPIPIGVKLLGWQTPPWSDPPTQAQRDRDGFIIIDPS